MTATPHAGKEEDFQLFLTLLDRDRFEGKYRRGAHADTSGLMRRMVKEDLLTFEGKPLFPERIAETVPYELSDGENAPLRGGHPLRARGDEPRRAARQRQPPEAPSASRSPCCSAVWRPARRRSCGPWNAAATGWSAKSSEMLDPRFSPMEDELAQLPWTRLEDPDELDAEEIEELEEDVVDAATAAQTVAELDAEIAELTELVASARLGARQRQGPQVDRAARPAARRAAAAGRRRARASSSSSPSTATP